jgi:hypothetical protein
MVKLCVERTETSGLREKLLGATPNQICQRISPSSIFLLWFGTFLHRGVSPMWLSWGCFATPISTRDAACFQLILDTTFKYNSGLNSGL